MIQRYTQFQFSRKGSRTSSPPHFVYDFSRIMFLMLYSINWPNFILWIPLLLQILGNIYIRIVCQPGCDVINFEINLIFLIKPFCYMTKNQGKNLNILRTKMFLRWNKKHFKVLSIAKNCFRPESASLKGNVTLWFATSYPTCYEIYWPYRLYFRPD